MVAQLSEQPHNCFNCQMLSLLRIEKLTVMCGSQQFPLIASHDVRTQTLSSQRRPSA